jgi:excisionase family DNA binding protein
MKKLVTIDQLSKETGFSVWTLYSFAASGKIPFYKFGYRTMRFDPPKVLAALERFEIPAVTAKNAK